MYTKVKAAEIVNNAGIDMVISNSNKLEKLIDIINGKESGTLFLANDDKSSNLDKYID